MYLTDCKPHLTSALRPPQDGAYQRQGLRPCAHAPQHLSKCFAIGFHGDDGAETLNACSTTSLPSPRHGFPRTCRVGDPKPMLHNLSPNTSLWFSQNTQGRRPCIWLTPPCDGVAGVRWGLFRYTAFSSESLPLVDIPPTLPHPTHRMPRLRIILRRGIVYSISLFRHVSFRCVPCTPFRRLSLCKAPAEVPPACRPSGEPRQRCVRQPYRPRTSLRLLRLQRPRR